MSRLVKGGKYVYGWTRVGFSGRIVIAPEALEDYALNDSDKLILLPGGKTSGGFGLMSLKSLNNSKIKILTEVRPELWEDRVTEGETIEFGKNPYCWVKLNNGSIVLPPTTLNKYGIQVLDKLLMIKGSGLALGFAVRGPIVQEADKHDELKIYEPEE
jgi:hypothetical protein